jgi:hypothetical protein
MSEATYSQGVCADGAAILKDGEQMTVEQIVSELNRCAMFDKTELSIKSYDAGYERGWIEATADYENRLRDEFAMAALQGLYANPNVMGSPDEIAIACYRAAGAMMEVRKR